MLDDHRRACVVLGDAEPNVLQLQYFDIAGVDALGRQWPRIDPGRGLRFVLGRTDPPVNSKLTLRRQTRPIGASAQLSSEAAARFTPVAVRWSTHTRPAVLPWLDRKVQWRRYIVHDDIGNLHVVQTAFRRHPRAWLKAEAGQHVRAVLLSRRTVLVAAGPIEQAVVDDQSPSRADQPDAVARGVDHAAVDQRVLPVTACDGVISLELAIRDPDVAARLILATPEMHAVQPPVHLTPRTSTSLVRSSMTA